MAAAATIAVARCGILIFCFLVEVLNYFFTIFFFGAGGSSRA